jgi:hypothetical protein
LLKQAKYVPNYKLNEGQEVGGTKNRPSGIMTDIAIKQHNNYSSRVLENYQGTPFFKRREAGEGKDRPTQKPIGTISQNQHLDKCR